MLRSELIEHLGKKFGQLSIQQIIDQIDTILETMADALKEGKRIELRGFGSFSLRHHPPRKAHNPKTGQRFVTKSSFRPHFKPGKELRARVDRQ